MNTEVQLGSVVNHGVGGSEAGAIALIYTFLLREFGQNMYSRIIINQIGDELKEFITRESGNRVHINFRYPVYEDFETKNVNEKNLIRLDVIHTALLKIAQQFSELQVHKLEKIKDEIIKNNFSFDFVYKTYSYGNTNNKAKLIVHPEIDSFDYFIMIEEKKKLKCRIQLYSGLTNLSYLPDLISQVRWKSINELIITGKAKEVEMCILVNECKITFTNLTKYKKAPYFEMMRADVSNVEREMAYQDWLHSLPPAHSAIIRQSHN